MLDMILAVLNRLIAVGDFLWGMPMLICLSLVAVIYTIGTKGFQFTHFSHCIKNTFGKQIQGKSEKGNKRGISSYQAMCMALCNTLGVGNIAGVAVSIALGGPGAVLWIWIAGVMGLIIKYAEITLGVKFREIDPDTGMYRGGLMWYVEKGLAKHWKWVAVVYAAVYVVVNINAPAVQINTIASSVTAYFDIPSLSIGIVAAVLMAMVLLGGVKQISNFAEKVVSVMSVAYFAVALITLVLNLPELPGAIGLIFRYAFTDAKAIAGGFGGASVAMAARYGFARGFYSNGAGVGDSPFCHSYSNVDHPVKQGLWGISEVVVDTIMCTCTALVILATGAWESGESGAALTAFAIGSAFKSTAFGNIFIMIAVAFFAFTTAVMCAHYGEICLRYFTKNRMVCNVYRMIICLVAVFATNPVFVDRVDILWRLGDFNVAVSILLSLITLVLLRKEVFASTEEYKKMI